MTALTQSRSDSRRLGLGVTASAAALAMVWAAPWPALAATPLAPTRVEAIASPGSVRLTFVRPDDESRVDSFRIVASTGVVFRVGDAPATLAPVANGVPVSFRVAAVSGTTAGPYSEASNTVTPRRAATTNTWERTDRMRAGRIGASALRLRNGTVLAVGGSSSGGPYDQPRRTAELYDPATKTWRSTGSMDLSRSAFTTTRLTDGRVLVTGGWTANRRLRGSTRLYDPATGRWSRGARLLKPRAGHAATLLPTGKVLVTGGWTGGQKTSRTAELYDPRTNRWSRTASMGVGRGAHSATRLLDGQVLVAGGTGDIFAGGLRSSETYNPDTGRWARAGNLNTVRTDEYVCCENPVRLADGRVLLAGGFSGDRGRGAELFDPTTRTWNVTGRLSIAREEGFALVRLRGSRVLAIGGSDDFGPLKYAELYDPATGRWSRVNDLRHDRYGALAVTLSTGQVLVAGGSTLNGARRSSELFVPR